MSLVYLNGESYKLTRGESCFFPIKESLRNLPNSTKKSLPAGTVTWLALLLQRAYTARFLYFLPQILVENSKLVRNRTRVDKRMANNRMANNLSTSLTPFTTRLMEGAAASANLLIRVMSIANCVFTIIKFCSFFFL